MKNSMLYRRLRYVRRRRAGSLHVLGKVIAISIIWVLLILYAHMILLPGISRITESWAKASLAEKMDDLIRLQLDQSLQYEALVAVDRDNSGNIIAVRPDTSGMNILSSQISFLMKEKLAATGKTGIGVPAGVLLGNSALRDIGPELQVEAVWLDDVEVTFESEFINMENGSTQYRINLEIKTAYTVDVPFTLRRHEVAVHMPVAEVVLVASDER
jgi:sporulation protein YunB